MVDRNEIERLGVNAVERAFLEIGWLFREQPISDYGIDAHAEPKDGENPTGQLIALQIKSGKSYFRMRGDNYVFYGEQRHLDYWQNHTLPVFIILHDSERKITLWQRVERQLTSHHEGGRWSIDIPPTQILDAGAARFIRSGISTDPASIRRFRMSVDLPLIREISKQLEADAVFLTLTEWVNKSLNFRESKLTYGDPDAEASYEFDTWLPMSTPNEVMNRYFPWLDYEYAREIENFSLEVEEHVFEVQINSLGRAFLEVEEYFENGQDLQEIEPLYENSNDSISEDDGFDEEEYQRIMSKRRDD